MPIIFDVSRKFEGPRFNYAKMNLNLNATFFIRTSKIFMRLSVLFFEGL